MFSSVFHWDIIIFSKTCVYRHFYVMAPPDQNREFPFFKITAKRTMSQENDHDFRDQHKILVLEMLTNPCGGLVTKILLHSVIAKPPGNGAILRTAFKLIKNSKTCIKRVLKKYTLFQLFQIQCQLESSIDHYTENVGVFVFSSSVFKMSKSLSQHLHFLGKLWA